MGTGGFGILLKHRETKCYLSSTPHFSLTILNDFQPIYLPCLPQARRKHGGQEAKRHY
jgi:hypothetical protein